MRRRSRPRGKSWRSETGYADFRDALADKRVDAVVVVTPTALHREVVLAAAKAGKHVLCEKPMAMDVRECDDMIAACDAARREAADRVHAPLRRQLPGGQGAHRRRGDRRRGAGEVPHPRSKRSPGVDVRHQEEQRPAGGGEQPRHRLRALVRRQPRSTRSTPWAAISAARRPCRSIPDFYDNVAMVCRFVEREAGLHRRGGVRGLRLRCPHGDRGHQRRDVRGQQGAGLRGHLLHGKGHRAAVREELAHAVHRSLL